MSDVDALVCPEDGCGSKMKLRRSKYGLFFGCVRFPDCKGLRKADADGEPTGTPSTSVDRRGRVEAHEAFDSLWKAGDMTRTQAYIWLSGKMNISLKETHIASFTAGQCETVVKLAQEYFGVAKAITDAGTTKTLKEVERRLAIIEARLNELAPF